MAKRQSLNAPESGLNNDIVIARILEPSFKFPRL